MYELRALISGEQRYFIIKVSPTKRDLFCRKIESYEELLLENYGEVLHRGWGTPSEDLKKILHDEYGMYGK